MINSLRFWLFYSVSLLLIGIPFKSIAATLGPELVTNGSFEEPIVNRSFQVFPSIPGWESTEGAGIEIQTGPFGSPFDGNQHVELDSFSSSNMFQDIPTRRGGNYRVQLAYSPRPGRTEADNAINVLWNNQEIERLSANGRGLSNTNWNRLAFDVVGNSDATRLEFSDVGPSNTFGGYLDQVSVREVPEPDPSLILGVTLLGLLIMRRYHKKGNEPAIGDS